MDTRAHDRVLRKHERLQRCCRPEPNDCTRSSRLRRRHRKPGEHNRAGSHLREMPRDRPLRPFTPLRCNLVSRIRRWAERTHLEFAPQSREGPQRNAKRSASAALPASAVQSSFPDLNLDRAHALGVGTAEPGGAAERFSETGLCGPSRLCGVKNTRPIWMVTLGHPYRRENTGGNSVDFCSYPFVVRLSVFLFPGPIYHGTLR